MTCVEYLQNFIKSSELKVIDNNITNFNYIDKQSVTKNKKYVFIQSKHIGVCELIDEYFTLKTDEWDGITDKKVTRNLSLFDDSVKIVYEIKGKELKNERKD